MQVLFALYRNLLGEVDQGGVGIFSGNVVWRQTGVCRFRTDFRRQ